MNIVLLILFSIMLATGQILFKKAALVSNESAGIFGLINIWLIVALGLYAIATILWVWLLKVVPLSFAYPFAALGFVLVPLAAVCLFGETLSIKYIIGSLLIISGIFFIGSTGQG